MNTAYSSTNYIESLEIEDVNIETDPTNIESNITDLVEYTTAIHIKDSVTTTLSQSAKIPYSIEFDENVIFTERALSDILYVVYGAFGAFGINADDAFDLVHKSNMSKLCKTELEAIQTVESYKNDPRYDSPNYRLSPNHKYYVVYNESTKKILKSIYYKPVSFDSLIKIE